MSETTRKTFKEKLRPTPTQERALDEVLWRCRDLYNTALEQRITAYQRRRVSLSRYGQEAELKDIRAEFPEYAAIHSHILQDVLARLDKTYQAFFRRVQRGEKAGFPRFKGRNRFHSFTFKEYGNGARLDNGSLVLSKIGRVSVHWSRAIEGTPKTITISHEADGWYVAISCADVPEHLLPTIGQETGIDVGLKVFLITADGDIVENPRHYRKAEKALTKAQRRVSRRKKGSHRRSKAVCWLAKAHQHVRRQRCDFHHKTALALVRAYDTIYVEAIQPANLSRRLEPKPDGNGGYAHNGASRKAGLNKSIQDAGWASLPLHPRFQGCKRREASGSGSPSVHVPGLQRMWGAHSEVLECSYPRLYQLWAYPGPRRERGQEHSMARTAPSGTRGDACGDEPRTRRALARAECQTWELH